MNHDVECEFVTAPGWANNEIRNATREFLNIDPAAFENIISRIAIKLLLAEK